MGFSNQGNIHDRVIVITTANLLCTSHPIYLYRVCTKNLQGKSHCIMKRERERERERVYRVRGVDARQALSVLILSTLAPASLDDICHLTALDDLCHVTALMLSTFPGNFHVLSQVMLCAVECHGTGGQQQKN
jgi:hypothetical protein